MLNSDIMEAINNNDYSTPYEPYRQENYDTNEVVPSVVKVVCPICSEVILEVEALYYKPTKKERVRVKAQLVYIDLIMQQHKKVAHGIDDSHDIAKRYKLATLEAPIYLDTYGEKMDDFIDHFSPVIGALDTK